MLNPPIYLKKLKKILADFLVQLADQKIPGIFERITI